MVASALSLKMEYLFLVGSSVFVSTVIQQLVANLVLGQKISTRPSTPPSGPAPADFFRCLKYVSSAVLRLELSF